MDLIIRFVNSNEDERNCNDFMDLSTKSFFSVWELMCKTILRDEFPSMQDKIPKPYWKIGDREPRYTEQIPDIIYKDNSELYVLDAKYYYVKKRLPGWPDLVKQYFYEMSLRAILPEITTSYNIMLIPHDITETARFLGISKVENAPQFGEIKGIVFNTKKVIENYCYGSKEDYRKLLKKVITEYFG